MSFVSFTPLIVFCLGSLPIVPAFAANHSDYETVVTESMQRPGVVELDSKDLERQGFSSLGQVISYQLPSVNLSQTQKGLQSLSIRGSKSEHILVLVDGIPVNDGSSPGGAFDFSQIPVSVIEKIKIILKPSSVEYGSSALAGTVDVQLKSEFARQYGAVVGTQYNRAVWANAEGLLMALESDDSSSSSTGSELDSSLRTWVGYHRRWDLNQKNQISFLSFWNQKKADLDDTFPVENDDPNAQSDLRSGSLGLSWIVRLSGEDKIQTTLSRFQVDRHELDYASGSDLDSLQKIKFDQTHLRSVWIKDSPWWQSMFGIEFKEYSFGSNSVFGGSSGSTETSEQGQQSEKSIFIKQKFQSLKGLSLGLRRDQVLENPFWQKSLDYEYQLVNSDTLSVIDQVTFSFGIAETEKSPSLYQLYSSYGTNDLRTEKSRHSYLKIAGSSTTAQVSIELFQTQLKDLVDYDSTTFRYQNIDRSDIRGSEFLFELPISNQQSLGYQSVYLEPRDQETGVDLIQRSRWTHLVKWGYQPNQTQDWGADLKIKYQSRQIRLDQSERPERWSSIVQFFKSLERPDQRLVLQSIQSDRSHIQLSYESNF